MRCPDEIAVLLLEMLTRGILMARATDDREQAVVELDHIHNIPDLLARYSIQKLDYYWNVERPCLERANGGLSTDSQLVELWEKLRPLVEKELRSAPSQSPTKSLQSRAS